jgi:hypothetical protein
MSTSQYATPLSLIGEAVKSIITSRLPWDRRQPENGLDLDYHPAAKGFFARRTVLGES